MTRDELAVHALHGAIASEPLGASPREVIERARRYLEWLEAAYERADKEALARAAEKVKALG